VELVLLHELAHVKRLDWPAQLVGEIACAASWFNPLAWLARARLLRESERACDDLVLACGVSASAYGHELASIARLHHRSPHPAATLPMARASSLERRIVAMLNPTIDRRPLTRRTTFAGAALAFAVLGLSATFQLAAQDQPGSFTVQVFDPSGAVLPGVAIELADARGETRRTATEGSGRAVFADVQTGEYTIGASLPGFRTLRAPIAIDAARGRQRSIMLQVGELSETVTVRERRPAPGSAPPASGVVEPLRVGGNIRAPRKLKHTSPEYPASMRDAGLEGIVPIEATIGRDGTVTSVRNLSADVHPEFARAAADAVSQWEFSPTLLNGEAVEVRMAVTVRFSLED
jgi:TonB family protein